MVINPENEGFDALYDSFCAKLDSVMENCHEKFENNIKALTSHRAKISGSFEDKVTAYNSLYAAVIESGKSVQAAHENNLVAAEHINRLQEEKISLLDLEKQVQAQVEQSTKLLDEMSIEKSALETEPTKRKGQYGKRQKSISQNMILTEKYLGLEVRPLRDNRVQFLFHNVFPEDSCVVMFVIIRLDNKIYELLDSEPPLDNLKELEVKLNETNNLAGFVQLVRKLLIIEAKKLSKENIKT
uniref:Kinetochore protein SPC25 n=1 Tax=Phallusia mammillata TaxID=59560 RepID=A0A6F9DQI2_9ASCI|nr:RAR nuclear receptor [Phallusia mammillata]